MRLNSRDKYSITVEIAGDKTASLQRVLDCYNGSNGDATKALYDELISTRGVLGTVAVNLLRAQKTSARAKVYRGGNGNGRYREQAYQTKQWAMDNLCKALTDNAAQLGIDWGWQTDPAQEYHAEVLYVVLPVYGQASFHTRDRGAGPAFGGQWDGIRGKTAERVIRFAADALGASVPAITGAAQTNACADWPDCP